MSTDGPAPAPSICLHLPDEPAGRGQWRAAGLDGKDLSDVVGGPDGIAAWLWARWSALDSAGMAEAAFCAVVVAYRRELWLWLTGDRMWEQCCAGLIGRIGRRLPSPASAACICDPAS